jgi:hypothetical protein
MALVDKISVAGIKLHQDNKGMTAIRSYLVPSADIFDTALPYPGTPWPGPPYVIPNLVCIEGNWEEEESGLFRATYDYSTERNLGDDFVDVSVDYATETMDTTRGGTWLVAGTKVQQSIPTVTGVEIYSLTLKTTAAPKDQIRVVRNTVNEHTFHGYLPETLRFDGATMSYSYDIDGNTISQQVTYKFTARDRSHNYIWREPVIDVDKDGNEIVYQNKDVTKTDSYTTDADLLGTKKVVGDPAGSAGWDKPTFGVDGDGNYIYRYNTSDFAMALGLAMEPGDG